MHHRHKLTRPFSFIAAFALVGIAQGQGVEIYLSNEGAGFPHYESVSGKWRIAVIENATEPVPSTRVSVEGVLVDVLIQEVRVVHGMPGTPSTLKCVIGRNRLWKEAIPTGRRLLLTYVEPSAGKAMLNTYAEVMLGEQEVAGTLAIPTPRTALAAGQTFEETVFGSMLDSIVDAAPGTMTDLLERIAHPPGMCLSVGGRQSARSMTEYLEARSHDAQSRAGLYDVAFHTLLGRWQIRGSGEALLDALLRTQNDARVEQILSWRYPFVLEGLGARKYDEAAQQARLLEGAKTSVSDQAAAILAARLNDPMKDFREGYLGLLRRDLPKLRAQVCNDLAVEFDKPERRLPFRKDKEGWEQRVADMAQTWLSELGG